VGLQQGPVPEPEGGDLQRSDHGSDDFFMGQGTKGQSKNQLKPSEEAIRQKIVPALKEALEKERANDIVTGCLIGLAKIGDVKSESGASEFEPLLSKFLSDGNQEIAETAAVALGILANDASVRSSPISLSTSPKGASSSATRKSTSGRARSPRTASA
jgi:hypothetical protein